MNSTVTLMTNQPTYIDRKHAPTISILFHPYAHVSLSIYLYIYVCLYICMYIIGR